MADRQVTRTKKNSDGDILALCNDDNNDDSSWSPQLKAAAIHDIKKEIHTYYVIPAGGTLLSRTEICIADGPTGEYLRTGPDDTKKNNLDNLPGCYYCKQKFCNLRT